MDVINPVRKQQILELLERIEQEQNITIIHAVESGSRAWGFPSADSDYDIRFIYYHPTDWYITAFEKIDYLEFPISDDLDAAGWDIEKCLKLLHKGNAVLPEWLNSPVVYRSNTNKHHLLNTLATQVFSSTKSFYHYYSLAKKKFLDEKTRNNAKSFLYGLRALLCANWITDRQTIPPVLFNTLVQTYLNNELQQALTNVLAEKAQGSEKDSFIVPNQLWCESVKLLKALHEPTTTKTKLPTHEYDAVLLKVLS